MGQLPADSFGARQAGRQQSAFALAAQLLAGLPVDIAVAAGPITHQEHGAPATEPHTTAGVAAAVPVAATPPPLPSWASGLAPGPPQPPPPPAGGGWAVEAAGLKARRTPAGSAAAEVVGEPASQPVAADDDWAAGWAAKAAVIQSEKHKARPCELRSPSPPPVAGGGGDWADGWRAKAAAAGAEEAASSQQALDASAAAAAEELGEEPVAQEAVSSEQALELLEFLSSPADALLLCAEAGLLQPVRALILPQFSPASIGVSIRAGRGCQQISTPGAGSSVFGRFNGPQMAMIAHSNAWCEGPVIISTDCRTLR